MTEYQIDPAQPVSNGERFVQGDHVGDLLLFVDPVAREVETTRGPSHAAGSRYIVVIDGEEAGEVYEDVLSFGMVLVPQLTTRGNEIVLGRLVRGAPGKSGRSAPWKLDEPSTSDKGRATKWMKRADSDGVLSRNDAGELVIDPDGEAF